MKDPIKQYQGKINKAKGKFFEQYIEKSFDYYNFKGIAMIEKTPEPMRPAKSIGNGKFIAFYEKKAQPDYDGTLKGGRTLKFEAKYTSTDRMEQSRVSREQAEKLSTHHRLGAYCFVIIGFDSGEVYRIPWSVWQNMKELYGRKYVTEADIENYRVAISRNGVLMLLENMKGDQNEKLQTNT